MICVLGVAKSDHNINVLVERSAMSATGVGRLEVAFIGPQMIS